MSTVIVGYDGGLGSAVADLFNNPIPFKGDIMHDKDILEFCLGVEPVDNLIYCAGVNKISKFDDVTSEDWFESMDVNCFGFVRLIQELRSFKCFNTHARACLVTSNAANIPMSHSLAYNCSKAAANIAVRQMAREISATELCIYGVAPNKLHGTGMSREIEKKVCEMRGWTEDEAAAYQLAALPAHIETDPKDAAKFIWTTCMMDTFYPYCHGTIFPFGGPQ